MADVNVNLWLTNGRFKTHASRLSGTMSDSWEKGALGACVNALNNGTSLRGDAVRRHRKCGRCDALTWKRGLHVPLLDTRVRAFAS